MRAKERMLPFTKLHGLGNDYIFVDCFKNKVANPARFARAISDRHFGVGSDGLILIEPSRDADVAMRIFNADGSEAEMCGNGIRGAAKYAYDHELARKKNMTVSTRAGIKSITLQICGGKAVGATVDMGEPHLRRGDIPMSGPAESEARDIPLPVGGEKYEAACVSMGNPHCVIFLRENIENFPLSEIGPMIERHRFFPRRINVHIVNRISRDEIRMRTWERGSGITLACGTGACAVCVAGAITGRTARKILAHLPGGDLRLDWRSNGHVYMSGPAVEVFSGMWLM